MYNFIMNEKYKEALDEAQAELAQLDKRRAALLELISDLASLCDIDSTELEPPPDYVPKGLTDEIRTIMGLTTVPLDAIQVRDSMLRRGFEKANPKNLLIAVHTVLGRIKSELDVSERDGKPAYIAKAMGRYSPSGIGKNLMRPYRRNLLRPIEGKK